LSVLPACAQLGDWYLRRNNTECIQWRFTLDCIQWKIHRRESICSHDLERFHWSSELHLPYALFSPIKLWMKDKWKNIILRV